MTFLVLESCIKCKLMDCVEVCPVDCFHEGPNMLVIDPEECIDCTLCEPECPVDAIVSEDEIPAGQEQFLELNAELSQEWPVITEAGRTAARRRRLARDPRQTPVPRTLNAPRPGSPRRIHSDHLDRRTDRHAAVVRLRRRLRLFPATSRPAQPRAGRRRGQRRHARPSSLPPLPWTPPAAAIRMPTH